MVSPSVVYVCGCVCWISSACMTYRTPKDPISVYVPGENLKCAPVERTRLPDWCLTFLLKSPDSLQIFFIRDGANKASRLSGKEGLKASLMYAARWDCRWIVMEVKDRNGASQSRIKRRGCWQIDYRGKVCVESTCRKYGSCYWTREVESRLERRFTQ